MKTTKGASYIIMAALMLASAPLILAAPANGALCGPAGIVPGLICPQTPDRPDPTATPAPTASATGAPVSPSAAPGKAPRPSAVPAPTGTQAAAPTAGPGGPSPSGTPTTSSSPADSSPTAPFPTSTAPSGPAPSETARSLAAKSPASADSDGRSVTGALLLALGGLLVIGWVFLDIRTSA